MGLSQFQNISAGQYYYDLKSQLSRDVANRSEQAFDLGKKARAAIRSPEELAARQKYIRETFLAAIGGLPAGDGPVNAQVTGKIDEKYLVIEKVILESRPGVKVAANLYLPKHLKAPAPAVLVLCGHAMLAKAYPAYQSLCRKLAAAGLIALITDPVGQGERFSYFEPSLHDSTVPWGTVEHDYAGAQCLMLGDGIARYFLHDAMRAVDYLQSRPEVNPQKIGVTGNSGGGTQTCMMMMADPRIAAAVPATFVMDRSTYMYSGGAQDAEQIWPNWSGAGLDHEDFIIAMCPRPVAVLAVSYDFFPLEGTMRTVQNCHRFYELTGASDHLEFFEDAAVHSYTPQLAGFAANFFCRHLGSTPVKAGAIALAAIKPEDLQCTRTGQVRGDDEAAVFVHEENLLRLRQLRAKPFTRAKAVNFLRQKIMDKRPACPVNVRIYQEMQADNLTAQFGFWRVTPGLMDEGILLRDLRYAGQTLPLTVVLWPGGTCRLTEHENDIRRFCEAGRAVLAVNLSAMGANMPHPVNAHPVAAHYGTLHKLNDDLLFLNDSLAALRTYELLRVADLVKSWPLIDAGAGIEVAAWGKYNIYGIFAQALNPQLRLSFTQSPLTSYREWVAARNYDTFDSRSFILPGLLKYADLDKLGALRS